MAAPKGLHTLARLHGVQTAYTANDGARVPASTDALLAALRALRVPVGDGASIPALLDHRRRVLAERVLEPVVVAWRHGDRLEGAIPLRLSGRHRDGRLEITVGLEGGGEHGWTVAGESLEAGKVVEADGRRWTEVSVPLPDLPEGYHDLRVATGRDAWTALLVVAPRRAADWSAIGGERPAWGVFAPLYALRTEGDTPPDFGFLDALAERVARHGGAVVGTLPVLAAFLDQPYEPSPYAPASRLFWNEMYVDPVRAPGADALDPEERAVGSAGGDRRWLDPRAVMAARRPALEALAARFFAGDPEAELAAFRRRNPQADEYAMFRALTERRGTWGSWPERLRARDVRPGDVDGDVVRYHLYVQWLAERQLAEATERASSRGVSLYLDLPLGVHPDGYDVWRDRALFARSSSAGAPPDPLAPQGQDWGFPPLHPEALRLDRHRYFISCIRKHLRFAKVLRIDHVMQLHRMFWVPAGDASDGVYVRYPAEELYAVLCLESKRANAVIVGEDLGTVPSAVRSGMRRHGLFGMYVAEFSLRDEATGGDAAARLVPGPVPEGAVASIGTHDTPTFGGWWTGRDAVIRGEEGILSEDEVEAEVAGRAEMREKLLNGRTAERKNSRTAEKQNSGAVESRDGALTVLRWLHEHMGRSEAGLVLATLEDLWLEEEPQNVPGTTGDRNWRRRSARPLEALDGGEPAALLEELDQARRQAE